MLIFKAWSLARAALSFGRSRTAPTTNFLGRRLPSAPVSRHRKIQTLRPPLRVICFRLPFWYRALVTEPPFFGESTDGAPSLLDYAATRPIRRAGIATACDHRRQEDARVPLLRVPSLEEFGV